MVDDPAYELPTISPDRKWMVYLEGDGDGRVPRLARVDGSESQPLLDDQMTQECPFTSRPAWSPDGSKLAFVCLSADQSRTGLWVVNRDGSKVASSWTRARRCRGRPGETTAASTTSPQVSPRAIPPRSGRCQRTARGTDPDHRYEDGWDSHVDWSDGGVFFLRSSSENAPGDTMFVTPDGFSKAFSDTGNLESPADSPDGTAAVWLEASPDDASSARCGSCATARTSRQNSSRATSARPRGVVAELRIRPGWPPG